MKFAQQVLEEISAHGEEGYPQEICGVLVGPRGSSRVTEARRASNIVVDRATDRYEIDPRDLLRIQRDCDERGLDVLGYYHSHPDHPAQPSVTDASRAWAGPVYVIVSVVERRAVLANAFIAQRDGGPFRQVPIDVI